MDVASAQGLGINVTLNSPPNNHLKILNLHKLLEKCCYNVNYILVYSQVSAPSEATLANTGLQTDQNVTKPFFCDHTKVCELKFHVFLLVQVHHVLGLSLFIRGLNVCSNISLCGIATKMKDNREQSCLERTTPPKHLRSSVWNILESTP